MFCGYCGKEVDEDKKFCPYCGQALPEKKIEAGESIVGRNEASIHKKRILVLCVIVAALAVMTILVISFLSKKKEDMSEQKTSNVTETIPEETLPSEIETNTETEEIDYSNIVLGASRENIEGHLFEIPRINLEGEEIERINSEIWDETYEEFVVFAKEHPEAMNDFDMHVSYDWYLNGGILSLVVNGYYGDGSSKNIVYNILLSEKRECTLQELLSVAEMTEDEYYLLVKQAAGSMVWNERGPEGDLLESESYIEQFNECLRKTLAEDNIKSARPFLNNMRDVCAYITIFDMAMLGSYECNIDLENFNFLVPNYDQEAVISKLEETEMTEKAQYSVDEIIELLLAKYNQQLVDNDGSYAIFEHEMTEDADSWIFILRYQMSEEAARKKIESGGTVSANVFAGEITVEKNTGRVTSTLQDDTEWYLW